MKRKNVILTMLVILGMVTFLDRINISVAGSSIMHDLQLSPSEWGWVQSAFILSYGLMQIPMGALGDRFGHRKILSLIVLWWSLFTAFTGLAGGHFVIRMPSPGLLHDKGWLLPDKGGLLNDKGWLLRILLFLVGLLADSRPTTEPLYI